MTEVSHRPRLPIRRLIGMLAVAVLGAADARAFDTQHRPIEQLKVTMSLHLGKTADWVAITDSAVWVGSTGPYAVHAIDPTTNRQITSVPLPGEPCAGLAVGFDSLWIPLCGRTGGLARVDLGTRRLTATYQVGAAAAEGGITTGAGSVWMVLHSGALARIDPADGTVRQRVRVPTGSFNPLFAEGRIWVTRATGAEVTSVDAASGRIIEHRPTGPHPRFLTSGNGAIWTLNQLDGSLSRIDVTGAKRTETLPLHTPGPGGDITFGAGRIWTTFFKFPLSIVDAARFTLLCQWSGAGGDSMGIGHDAIWLTSYRAGTISRIALADIPPDCQASSR